MGWDFLLPFMVFKIGDNFGGSFVDNGFLRLTFVHVWDASRQQKLSNCEKFVFEGILYCLNNRRWAKDHYQRQPLGYFFWDRQNSLENIAFNISSSEHCADTSQILTLTIANFATFCQQRLRKTLGPNMIRGKLFEKISGRCWSNFLAPGISQLSVLLHDPDRISIDIFKGLAGI